MSKRSNPQSSNRPPAMSNGHVGSGSDSNSESGRLHRNGNLQDKIDEDTFPASDAPSQTPVLGISHLSERAQGALAEAGLPADFKDNKEAQFNYGRRVEQATHHFDAESQRLYRGNPDVGEVDLGTIEADAPAEPDDNDHND